MAVEGLALAAGMVVAGLVSAGPATASPLCEYRSTIHQEQHGGFEADNLWHIARGDLPTCKQDSNEASHDDSDDDDRKSRWCRKHWYC